MNVLYTAEATSVGGRDGGVKTADGTVDLQLAVQKELGGPGGPKSNPEDLFAAGYAACFHSALKLAAGKMHVPARDSKVTARVGIGPEGESFALDVELIVALPGVEATKAEELVRAAHSLCPYSKATRGNVPVRLALLGDDGAARAVA
ncbi:MAG: organic hydroperoxide resistance protein [Vulcanimicrobiaceae bacterium]